MARTILLAVLLQLPSLAVASPLELECSGEQKARGRALVCEYFMLERLNAQLARLHDHIAAAGRAGRVEARRWLAARDACRDVDCLDRLYETGIREARLALIDVETRTPAFVVSNARGDVLRVVEKAPPPAPLPFEVKSIQEAPARERSGVGLSTALALLAALITYAMVVKRLAV